MADYGASKVIVEEEEPKVRGIPSAPTSIAAAIGIAERGPIDQAVLCSSFEEYERVFGGFTTNSDLALAAMGFFENGGAQMWCVRICHHTDIDSAASAIAKKASGMASSSGGTELLKFEGLDAGAYANSIVIDIRAPLSADVKAFDLVVEDDGVIKEIFRDLSMNPTSPRYVETVVNGGSVLIRVQDHRVQGSLLPDFESVDLAGGDDGLTGLDDSDFIGSATGRTGMRALDAVQDVALLLVPGRATPAVHNAMIRYCEVERAGMLFAVLDPPTKLGAVDIVKYVETTAGLLNLSEFGAIYWPRVKVLNPSKAVFGSADQIVVPPSGIIAGVFARTDAARSGGVYDPPAGIENGRMFGVLGFEIDEVLEERKRDLVYPKRINPLTTGPGMPRFIDGSRTLKGNGNFPYVAERRGVSFIERSLKAGLQFARHRNNTESLRATVRRTISSFLLTQMNNGAFSSREPAKAYFVDVSEKLNTAAVIASGQLIARVGLATNKPAEFVILKIAQDTRAMSEQLTAAGA